MGLADYNLVWHQSGGGWIARAELRDGAESTNMSTYRFAHVDIHPWHIKRIEGKVFVEMQRSFPDQSWHDSIDAAKLHVEAIFALEQ